MKSGFAKKLSGFTLVELIVVIAIIGILAAILVPSMMGYIRNSRFRTANTNAKEVYTAAATYCSEYAANIEGKAEPESVKATIHDWNSNSEMKSVSDAVNKYLGADAEGTYYAVKVNEQAIEAAYWSENNDTEYVGSYPTPNNADDPSWANIVECVQEEVPDAEDETT